MGARSAVCGLWLIVSPFVLGYSTMATALWNDDICGIVAVVVAAIAARAMTETPTTA